jgi:hypothetical protein
MGKSIKNLSSVTVVGLDIAKNVFQVPRVTVTVQGYGDSAVNYRCMNSPWRSPRTSVIRALSP